SSIADTDDEQSRGVGVESSGVSDALLAQKTAQFVYDVMAREPGWLVDQDKSVCR
ncbi:MAG: hypothetical protein RJA15_1623, partial [Actinomycetota bacterium]